MSDERHLTRTKAVRPRGSLLTGGACGDIDLAETHICVASNIRIID